MVMAGYTKGPWVARAIDHNDGKGVLFWDINVPDNEDEAYRGVSARVHDSENIDGITKDEAESNANLIAAAPDMYEALKAHIRYETCPSQESPSRWREFVTLREAALDKAEGSK